MSCKKEKKANFDAAYELEELLLQDNPLQSKPRKSNSPTSIIYLKLLGKAHESSSVAQQMLKMEEKFAVFDYTKLPSTHIDISVDVKEDKNIETLTKEDKNISVYYSPLTDTPNLT